ncbi:MAG: SusC/RagA family TonB-linked outer membrane protein, partial [Bacteroidales bacterium]|nr:SusC/RagA family TonB-linked outer membrane protein [Bacteroidales bacterium]
MKKLMLLAVLLLSNIGLVTAQVTTVSGTVTSAEDGYPVVGAYVLVEGTTIGTSTNLDGNFTLPGVPADAKNLIVSFVGMRTVKVPVSKVVNVILQQDAEAIEETMVVAYGVAKKSSFTGAASTVRGEKIQKMQVSNISKSLEGAIAGVQVASSSGSPGDGASIIVRGLGSISSSQSPLIVVDGVPYEGSLNSISTQDIESLTVLKDAAANSMYGARGSNGVIIITTKGSKSGKPRINFDARYGVNTRAVSPYDIITDHGEYYEMAYEAYRNSLVDTYGWAGASDFAAKNLIGKVLKYNSFKGVDDDAIIDPVTGKLNSSARLQKWDDNWNTEGFRKGQRQEYNFNVSGGTDATQAYMSLGYLSEEGIAYGSGFDRISARVKVDQKIGKYVKVGGNIAYANTNQNWFGSAGSNYSNIFMFSQMIAPIYPIYDYDDTGKHILDESGNWAYDFGTTRNRPYASEQNPVAITQLDLDRQTGDNLSSRGYIDVNFLKDFKFTVNVAYDVFNNNETAFSTPVAGDAASVNGRGYRYSTRRGALNVNQLLNWSRSFGKHNVNILLGHESKNDMYKYLMGHMTNFALDGNPDFANATTYQELTSYTSEYALEGYFSKGEYNFADKYYLTASYRRDGSSRFAADNRWGSFWAVGASWRVTEEPWMKNVTAIDALKVKASYGTQGNDNVGYTHNYEDLYVVNRVDGDAAFSKVNRGNPDLTWEKSNNFNVGFEMGLISRINVNFDFFIKETKDMLFYSPLPTSEGSPSGIYRNEMDMKNTGI